MSSRFIVAKVGFTTGLAVLSTGRWARTLPEASFHPDRVMLGEFFVIL